MNLSACAFFPYNCVAVSFLIFNFCLSGAPSSQEFALTDGYSLSISIPLGMVAKGISAEDRTVVMIGDENGETALRLMLWREAAGGANHWESVLKKDVLAVSEVLRQNAVEKNPKIFRLKGEYFSFAYLQITDSREGETGYRYALPGVGISRTHRCHFMILCKSRPGKKEEALLKALQEMTINGKPSPNRD